LIQLLQKQSHSAMSPASQTFAHGSLLLRPTNPAGLDILAQCPRPRETRCKTSYAKRFVKVNVYLRLLLDRVLEADPIRDHYPKANSQCHQP